MSSPPCPDHMASCFLGHDYRIVHGRTPPFHPSPTLLCLRWRDVLVVVVFVTIVVAAALLVVVVDVGIIVLDIVTLVVVLIVSVRALVLLYDDYNIVGLVEEVAMTTYIAAVWQTVCTIATRKYQYH